MKRKILISILAFVASVFQLVASTQLRRPISPQQPMWLIHIDTWNYPDPQKIIDLIPDDIKPYVVMNIGLSISHDEATSRFKVAEYGYEIAKSWLRVCAQNRMWAIVQLSSGGYAQFSDFDLSVYEEFYLDYPNLIGFNYAEQFWGFGDPDPLSAKWDDRINHFANMLELSNRYGGYLVVSWCGNQWSPNINPIAMLKRNPKFEEACRIYTENYILCEKYTQQSYISDMESLCLGAYLSGYSGQYGLRYDESGWSDANGENKNFTLATEGAVRLEHTMLTGQTVFDGPELIWLQCFRETNRATTADGYTMRKWETFPQFDNVSVDIFRKVLDGTVRIPSREEVIDRTKYVIINDVNTGGVNDIYSSPQTLYEGLYRMDGDGNYENNKTFFKKSGRYPSIPVVYQLSDELANTFQFKVKRSEYANRWQNISNKVNEFNSQFASEYFGDLYAGRHENGWVVYNPYKTEKTASSNIYFRYNTCDSLGLSFSQYASGVVKEFSDKLNIYLNNYDNALNTGLKTNVITVYGSSERPTFSFTDRANHQASTISDTWVDGVFTLTVRHNGPLDITINCKGTASNRQSNFTTATLVAPDKPIVYEGALQYEAECFDYKNISSVITAGQDRNIRNYTGQGYLAFGTNSVAVIRDTVSVVRQGNYQLITRYMSPSGTVNTIDLYVNGLKIASPEFSSATNPEEWTYNTLNIDLKEGKNEIMFKANATSASAIYFDNIVVVKAEGVDVGPAMVVSRLYLDAFEYVNKNGPSAPRSFTILGKGLVNNASVTAPADFEVSLNAESGYSGSITLPFLSLNNTTTTIYVRMKAGLPVSTLSGEISLKSSSIEERTVKVSGVVKPQPSTQKYDFTADVASTAATNPPAINATIGAGNTATAGVTSFQSDNTLRPYSGGQRNSTGVINLGLFPQSGTDYSVTWKQSLGSNAEYKVGMLLRGDVNGVGDASSGYVQGIMNGYLCLVYNTGTTSQFRIYRSESAYNVLNTMVNTTINSLVPIAGQPIWYRATVSGDRVVNITFEYSTDGVDWKMGASTTDATSTFTSGATQIVWGLGTNSVNFYLDDISFEGLHSNSTGIDVVSKSDATVVKTQYFNLFGQQILYPNREHGVVIVRQFMSDGTVQSYKTIMR